MSLAQRYQPITCTASHQLIISDDGSIRSSRFNDIYFNAACGAEETRHVFLEGNHLEQRWRALLENGSPTTQSPLFVIAETGFGSGLNFLAAANLWQSNWANHQNIQNIEEQPLPCLYYYSCERYPLTRVALKNIIGAYNPFPKLAEDLFAKYPDPIAGSYLLRFDFEHCQIKLNLLFGDSVECLQQLEHYPPIDSNANSKPLGLGVDAWFLDGFAPAVNPDMWSQQLFGLIQRHSHQNTSLATFSAARPVKDQLLAHNFSFEKWPGFGKKRNMISAHYNVSGNRGEGIDKNHVQSHAPSLPVDALSPCYYRPVNSNPIKAQRHCTVIGSGIAGSCVAHQLANDGWKVTVIDANNSIAQGASGNRIGILYARTAKQRSALADFHEAALSYAVSFYRDLKKPEITSGLNGMIKLHEAIGKTLLTHNPELDSRKNIDQSSASALAGLNLAGGGIFYSDAGFIQPNNLCTQLLQHANINVITNTPVTSLKQIDNVWHLYSNEKSLTQADSVVIACGHHSNTFTQTQWLPIKSLRGQTTELSHEHGLYPLLDKIKISVCDKGYVTPAVNQQISIGASFTLNNQSPDSTDADHHENLQKLADSLAFDDPAKNAITALQKNNQAMHKIAGRTAFRAVMPDYLPVAGPVIDQPDFLNGFASLSQNAKQIPARHPTFHDGLYVIAGFGSHGFTTAPLAAELLAAQINHRPIAFSDKLRQAIAPQRFVIRQLVRGKT